MASSKDYRTDAEVVWCPGCGDFGVMSALSKAFAVMAIPRENIALISGIGCSSRLPGYFEVFGFNTVHGRALPIAQGVKVSRPDLTVVVASGDGDALAIGAGHFLHAGRRNTDITLVLFDNQVYGLTKGQPSPTTPKGDVMQLASYGVQETPLQPASLAINCGATFVARGFSGDPKHLQGLLVTAIRHSGFSVVQVLTPCVTFRQKWDPFALIKEKKAYVSDDHDATDRIAAMALAEDPERINLGVLYRRQDSRTFCELMESVAHTATAEEIPPVEAVLKDFIQ